MSNPPTPDPTAALPTTDGSATSSPGEPAGGFQPLSQTERYKLLDEVARGGMGVVYLATDAVFGREVAVKVLQERFAPDSGPARRFLDEARITGTLQHPAIPPVHDVGVLPDGRPFLAMKLIKGRTLDDELTARAKPAADRGRFLGAFEQVCQAVAFAHAHRVIHRDLKPQNVMVGEFGEVQVMDWGLAKVLASGEAPDASTAEAGAGETGAWGERESDGSFTQAGSMLGTPAFMPPEQAGGELDRIDERADVFGLGAILCVILTGQPPYAGKTAEQVRLMAVRGELSGALARLDACGAEPDLVVLCKRCLALDPADRPRNAGGVAAEVAGLRAAAEQRARQAELDRVRAEGEREKAAAEAREQRKRRRVQLALAASMALLAVGGGVAAWWTQKQSADRRAEVLQKQIEDEQRAGVERERTGRNADAVSVLLDRCEVALRDHDDAEEADVLLTEAEKRAAEGGCDHLKDRLVRCRADVEVLKELDRIDEVRWTPNPDGTQDPQVAVQALLAALRHINVEFETDTPINAAERVNASLIRFRLLTALDRMVFTTRKSGDLFAKVDRSSLRTKLLALLAAADPDEYRNAIRRAIADEKMIRFKVDASELQQLVDQDKVFTQPVWFCAALGTVASLPKDRQLAILAAAHRARPRDFQIVMGGAHAARSPSDSLSWYRAAVALRPKNAAAWSGLGWAFSGVKDDVSAVACLRETIRLSPKNMLYRASLVFFLRERKQFDAALSECREAIRIAPNDMSARIHLTATLSSMGDYAGAVESVREKIKLKPRAETWFDYWELGLLLEKKGDVDGAIEAFQEAIRVLPTVTNSYPPLGRLLEQKGRLPEAEMAYKALLRIWPYDRNVLQALQRLVEARDPNAHLIRADLQKLQGKWEAVIKDSNGTDIMRLTKEVTGNTERVTFAKPDGMVFGVAKFDIRLEVQEKERVYLYFNGVQIEGPKKGQLLVSGSYPYTIDSDTWTERKPERTLVWHRAADPDRVAPLPRDLGQLAINQTIALRLKGDFDGAVAAGKEAVRAAPASAQAHFELGYALYEKRDLDGAIASYREAIKLNPAYVAAHNGLGLALWRKRDYDGAIAAYREALRLSPKFAGAHSNLGLALQAKGDLDGALAAQREAIRLDPKSAIAHNNLGVVLRAKGDLDGAIAAYREALRLNPDYALAKTNLNSTLKAQADRTAPPPREVKRP